MSTFCVSEFFSDERSFSGLKVYTRAAARSAMIDVFVKSLTPEQFQLLCKSLKEFLDATVDNLHSMARVRAIAYRYGAQVSVIHANFCRCFTSGGHMACHGLQAGHVDVSGRGVND